MPRAGAQKRVNDLGLVELVVVQDSIQVNLDQRPGLVKGLLVGAAAPAEDALRVGWQV